MGHRNPKTTYHANIRINTIMDLRFNKMLPYVVEVQKRLEDKGRQLLGSGEEGLESRSREHAEFVV